MKRLAVLLLVGLTSATMLFGCGKKDEGAETTPIESVAPEADENGSEAAESEAAEDEAPPEEGMVRSDLTNEWIDGDLAAQRPIAVMIPDENAALPHYGISKADILYECNVEGDMTRLMAVIKDWQGMDRIGNVRSCRDYFVYWALEWDALYCHFGGPFYILDIINKDTTQNITGAVLASDSSEKKGLYDGAFFRSSDRKAPHNAYLSSEGILKAVEKLNYPLEYREDLYQSDHFKFAAYNSPNTLTQYSDAVDANTIDMSSAYPKTKTYFEYNAEDGLYYRFQGMQSGDEKHIDAVNNEQLSFKNVIIQFTYYEVRDAKGYLAFQAHDNTRMGYYFTNGKGIPITWEKSGEGDNPDFNPTKYYDKDGNEIELNTGKTMICIVEDGDTFEVE